jgi:hypothetical protein
MGWIKRNLFFVIGGVVTLGLLGAGGFYIYTGWDRNSQAAEKLNEIYGTLRNLQTEKFTGGSGQVDNTRTAREQEKQLRSWIDGTTNYFQPIPAIPADDLTSENFAEALRRTVDALQREAGTDGVTLPPGYDFSFSAQRLLVNFASGSLEPLAVQLGEVKAIAETVFAARVNALDGIQRLRVSADDAAGSQGDYTDDPAVTNNLAVLTPYVITFRCFTPELARVVTGFADSPNMFLIKSINVEPAAISTSASGNSAAGNAAPVTSGLTPWGLVVPAPAAAAPAADKGGLQTVLKEQLLRVTLEVEIVKLLPKS